MKILLLSILVTAQAFASSSSTLVTYKIQAKDFAGAIEIIKNEVQNINKVYKKDPQKLFKSQYDAISPHIKFYPRIMDHSYELAQLALSSGVYYKNETMAREAAVSLVSAHKKNFNKTDINLDLYIEMSKKDTDLKKLKTIATDWAKEKKSPNALIDYLEYVRRTVSKKEALKEFKLLSKSFDGLEKFKGRIER